LSARVHEENELTGGDFIIRTLIEQGIRHAFGIPGALNAGLYDALREHRDTLHHVLVRHELGAAWMADGYSRVTGEPGLCLTVPGPGTTHATSGIAGAYTDCAPVFLLATSTETTWGGTPRRDLFHGLDQKALFAPVTKWNARAETTEQLPELMSEAFRQLRNGRPGPVHLEVPADLLTRELNVAPLSYIEKERPGVEPGLVARAVAALREAERPLILADDGVLHSGAWSELGDVAAALRAPVITTVLGKGALPDDHPWALGDMNSTPGSTLYPEADLVFAVGCRFVQVDTRWPFFQAPPRLIHLDADATEIGRSYAPEVGLAGDPRTVLAQVREALGEQGAGRSTQAWSERVAAMKGKHEPREPLPVLAGVRAALARDGISVFDVCVPGFHSRWDWPIYTPRTYLYPGVYVGMGYGLPAAIGAKVAFPQRQVVSISGDAGFQMTMAELATAAQHNIGVVSVVVNDGGLTLIKYVQDRQYGGRRFEVDLVNPDFARLGASYGIEAVQLTDPSALGPTVERLLSNGRPALVELKI
jgi:acetolactate synthase-1/2/3 large subunit